MIREGRDGISVCCMKNGVGNIVSVGDSRKDIWRISYMVKMSGMVKWVS